MGYAREVDELWVPTEPQINVVYRGSSQRGTTGASSDGITFKITGPFDF